MPAPLGGGPLGGLVVPNTPTPVTPRSRTPLATTFITLKAPYSAPTKAVELRLPELGDADTFGLNITPQKFMDGSIKTYVSTPVTEKFVWHFTQITLTKWIELRDFLLYAQGKDILLTDYNNVEHKARILNNILDFKFSGRGSGKTTVRQESVDCDLEFEILA